MFERSFDGQTGTRAPERKPVTLKPEQYDALKKESFDAGFAAGHKAGLEEHDAQFASLVDLIGNKIEHLLQNAQAFQKQSEEGMRRIALAISRKFLPDFITRNGTQEIEAILSEVMTEMIHEPRLVVRIHESQFDTLNEKINTLATQKAYAGKVVVLADAEIAVGDCRIEWADGGMERNTEATWNQIENVVAPPTT